MAEFVVKNEKVKDKEIEKEERHVVQWDYEIGLRAPILLTILSLIANTTGRACVTTWRKKFHYNLFSLYLNFDFETWNTNARDLQLLTKMR